MKKITFLGLTTVVSFQIYAQEPKVHECDHYKFWAQADYLCWWMKDSPEPVPLIVRTPDMAPADSILEFANSTVILGDQDVDLGTRSGARFTAGGWFTKMGGMEADYFFLPQKSKTISVSSNAQPGSESLILPFRNAITNAEDFTWISFPGSYAGYVDLKIQNDMQGAEGYLLTNLYRKKSIDLSLMTGFQWWNFNETLSFKTNSPNIAPPLDIFQTQNKFGIKNNFYGGLVGLNSSLSWKWFTLEMTGKIGLGSMNSNVRIQGELATNFFTDYGATQVFSAGYFALSTNEGKFHRNRFAVIPEFDVNLQFKMAKWVGLEIGYSFLYATEVLWAGNAIDRVINTSQAPAISITPSTTLEGVARPKPLFKTEGLWTQGINVGLKFCY